MNVGLGSFEIRLYLQRTGVFPSILVLAHCSGLLCDSRGNVWEGKLALQMAWDVKFRLDFPLFLHPPGRGSLPSLKATQILWIKFSIVDFTECVQVTEAACCPYLMSSSLSGMHR